MRKLILIALIFISCSEEDIKPQTIECDNAKTMVISAEKKVSDYKAAGGQDWAVLAELRKEVARLEDYKNITCGTKK